MPEAVLDARDRAIINRLQDGISICERPFEAAAAELGLKEKELLQRLDRMLKRGILTRFGPLYQIERAGGALVLAAMQVPIEEVERVAAAVNRFHEVAHNYLREHRFNLWFVIAADTLEQVERVVMKIETDTGHPVYVMPKLREYFLDLRLAA